MKSVRQISALLSMLFVITMTNCGKEPTGDDGNGNGGDEPDYEDDFGVIWQLTSLPGNEINPTWSPDGSTIAFVWDRDGTNKIYLTPATGGPVTQLTNTEATDPCWSPEGSSVLYDDNDNDRWSNPDIYIIDVNTGETQLITEGIDRQGAFDPYWFPDMSKIIFVSYLENGYPYHELALYTMELPDGVPERITNPYYEQEYLQPAISQDGKELAYYFYQREEELLGQELVRVIVAGPLNGTGDSYSDDAIDPYPTWSPNNLEVAYIANSIGYRNYNDLFVYSFVDGKKRRIVDSTYRATTPAWSPDGSRIAFANKIDALGDYNIWIVELNE